MNSYPQCKAGAGPVAPTTVHLPPPPQSAMPMSSTQPSSYVHPDVHPKVRDHTGTQQQAWIEVRHASHLLPPPLLHSTPHPHMPPPLPPAMPHIRPSPGFREAHARMQPRMERLPHLPPPAQVHHHVPETHLPQAYHHHAVDYGAARSQSSHPLPQHSHPFVYNMPTQVVGPVAQVPVGATQYAHLPPSIWAPPHVQYYQAQPSQQHDIRSFRQIGQPLHAVQMHAPLGHDAGHRQHIVAQSQEPSSVYHTQQAPLPSQSIHRAEDAAPQIGYHYAHLQPSHSPTHPTKALFAYPATYGHDGVTRIIYSAGLTPSSSSKAVQGDLQKVEPMISTPRQVVKRAVENPDGFIKSEEGLAEVSLDDSSAAKRLAQVAEDRGCLRRQIPEVPIKIGSPGSRASSGHSHRTGGSQRHRVMQLVSQTMRKPRKPYTITKSREVWTQDEHARFVHALQLYDRDWKKIEVFIGTKSVLQIRSHAQKHFGKVAKYKTGEYIPPPRPKKRAVLPYPRSRSSSLGKSITGTTGPSSDSCAGLDTGTDKGSGSGGGSAANGAGSETAPSVRGEYQRDTIAAGGGIGSARIAGCLPKAQDTGELKPAVTKETKSLSSAVPDSSSCSPTAGSSDQECVQGDSSEKHVSHESDGTKETPLARSSGNMASVAKRTEKIFLRDLNANRELDSKAEDDAVLADVANAVPDASKEKPNEVNLRNTEGEQNRANFSIGKNNMQSFNNRDDDCQDKQKWKGECGVRTPTRAHINVVKNSLLVLSNCVDLMAKESPPDRQPAPGWATAAAARRAHRAKVIRGRNSPPRSAPSSPLEEVDESQNSSEKGSLVLPSVEPECFEELVNARGPSKVGMTGEVMDGQAPGASVIVVQESVERAARGGSFPSAGSDEGNENALPDVQRFYPGSGTNSDDAIAGFSSSDRPSVSDLGGGLSSNGSGSGGSSQNGEAGECDPKSSNDGSGDDINGRIPITRDSSPGDPTSSGSRENSPNEASIVDAVTTPRSAERRLSAVLGPATASAPPNANSTLPRIPESTNAGSSLATATLLQGNNEKRKGRPRHFFGAAVASSTEEKIVKEIPGLVFHRPKSTGSSRGQPSVASLCSPAPECLSKPHEVSPLSRKRTRDYANDTCDPHEHMAGKKARSSEKGIAELASQGVGDQPYGGFQEDRKDSGKSI